MVEDRDVEDMQPLLATRVDGCFVTLNRPERANALNDAMVDSF
jgi:enoyl-CoA hydratase/carnithine racemase